MMHQHHRFILDEGQSNSEGDKMKCECIGPHDLRGPEKVCKQCIEMMKPDRIDAGVYNTPSADSNEGEQ